ncbi:PaaX family transcriptional regulator C-terminal domain-containing protein [Georgenia sp. Z1491]|uniref:PaaX family transcriptional regulator n=1 Tax=Georgenia sp. Z1491 TaxID=3416707 RepID=UPI003CF3964E
MATTRGTGSGAGHAGGTRAGAGSGSGAGAGGGGHDGRLAPLILTIFGLYARREDNWISVASVVSLMADLDVDGLAVRSSISRLKRRGVLRSERRGGAAGYALSEDALGLVAEGDRRIFDRRRATEEDGWLLVVFSVPESHRARRHELRSHLTRLGLGTIAPGFWVAPANLEDEVRHTLERHGLHTYVNLFRGEHLAYGDLRERVARWWELGELGALYSEFLARHDQDRVLAESGRSSARDHFRAYVPMLTRWRRLPYRDPGLPLTLLPENWPGESARALFERLDAVMRPRAEEHALSVIHDPRRGEPG